MTMPNLHVVIVDGIATPAIAFVTRAERWYDDRAILKAERARLEIELLRLQVQEMRNREP